jgi:hypothetical protein
MLLREVREALARALEPIPGLSVHSFVPGTPSPPSLCVGDPPEGIYAEDYDGQVTTRIPVHAFLPTADDMSAAALYDELLSSEGYRSIYAAVEADPTLDGTCARALVFGWERVTVDDPDTPIIHLVVQVDVIE